MIFEAGLADLINALMLGGARVDAENRSGKTALIVAAEAGQVMAIQTLVNVGARVERESSEGITALIAAANAGQVRTLLVLNGSCSHRVLSGRRSEHALSTRSQPSVPD